MFILQIENYWLGLSSVLTGNSYSEGPKMCTMVHDALFVALSSVLKKPGVRFPRWP